MVVSDCDVNGSMSDFQSDRGGSNPPSRSVIHFFKTKGKISKYDFKNPVQR